jgi:hypothetical protein
MATFVAIKIECFHFSYLLIKAFANVLITIHLSSIDNLIIIVNVQITPVFVF